MKDSEEFNVGRVAELVGVTPQTIRNYVKRGLLSAEVDESNGYRRFTTDTVNRSGAIRLLSNIGMTLSMVKTVLSDISYEEYLNQLEKTREILEERIDREKLLLEYVKNHTQVARQLPEILNQCSVVDVKRHYCLDYQRGESMILETKKERVLMSKWYQQAPFARNYSPYPIESLKAGGVPELIIGVTVREEYVQKFGLPTDPPVYFREGGKYVKVLIHHDFNLSIYPDGPGFLWEFLEKNRLSLAAEPFIIAEGTYFEDSKPFFYSYLYIPVQ